MANHRRKRNGCTENWPDTKSPVRSGSSTIYAPPNHNANHSPPGAFGVHPPRGSTVLFLSSSTFTTLSKPNNYPSFKSNDSHACRPTWLSPFRAQMDLSVPSATYSICLKARRLQPVQDQLSSLHGHNGHHISPNATTLTLPLLNSFHPSNVNGCYPPPRTTSRRSERNDFHPSKVNGLSIPTALTLPNKPPFAQNPDPRKPCTRTCRQATVNARARVTSKNSNSSSSC